MTSKESNKGLTNMQKRCIICIMINKKHYIYGLIDPRSNHLFYIGVTHDLDSRLAVHSQCAGNGFKKKAFVKQMRAEGFKPQIVILQTCGAKSAKHIEKQWIQFSMFLGANLINEKQSTENGIDIRDRFGEYAQAKAHSNHLKKRNAAIKTQLLRVIEKMEL